MNSPSHQKIHLMAPKYARPYFNGKNRVIKGILKIPFMNHKNSTLRSKYAAYMLQ